ncbi:transporter, partial [Roseomonas sp. M0104]
SVFVPQSVWNMLFLIADGGGDASPTFLVVLENALVAPVVAFFTFIGSMGNVPLAAMLWSREASLGGVMSFLGADLVAATVVWVHVKYYGWRYALYLSALLYVCMAAAGITVHYLFAAAGLTPEQRPALEEMVRFAIDHTFFLNLTFLVVAGILLWLHLRGGT